MELSVPALRCGGCIRTIEDSLGALPGVVRARANLTTRRVRVTWRSDGDAALLIDTLAAHGFEACLPGPTSAGGAHGNAELSRHIKALAVAGFAAGNVMMLSIGVWSGADATTRALFHVLSALIALPALAYAGRLFFAPAWQALRHGHVNMDVPISIGILVTALMSVHDTLVRGEAVYFDAALMLVFFLLIGRTLDQRMRDRARDASEAVSRFEPDSAQVIDPTGGQRSVTLEALRIGDRVRLDIGARVPVDATVEDGRSTVDRSLVTGESVPVDVAPGAELQAGTLNLVAPLVLCVTAEACDSFLARIRLMMQQAQGERGRYRRIADRAATLYAPVVHLAALLTFIGWWASSGDVHHAVSVAVAVLIITCPCALGLAVPVVQVIAARRLMEIGVVVRDGGALERLAGVDTVVFDKTGTLTTGRPGWEQRTADTGCTPDRALALARALARVSVHPHARALMGGERAGSPASIGIEGATEHAGLGLEARCEGRVCRLGRPDWAVEGDVEGDVDAPPNTVPGTSGTRAGAAPDGDTIDEDATRAVLSIDGRAIATFTFHDTPRPDARPALEALRGQRLDIELLSGDAPGPVALLASRLGITRWRATALPGDKLARVQALQADGRTVLMVGDGVNDSPALAAASVSMAPGSATEVGRCAADVLLLQDRLLGAPGSITIARAAHRLVRQNMTLALLYNLCAMPLAMAGLVTPLIAALSMSLSSVLVILNALRLTRVPVPTGAPCDTRPDRTLLAPEHRTA